MNLRNSLQIIPSSQSNMEKADELEASVSEADNLLQMFRQSLSSFPTTDRSSINLGSPRASSFSQSLTSLDDAEALTPILEKYSDKLLEIMTRKLGGELPKKS